MIKYKMNEHIKRQIIKHIIISQLIHIILPLVFSAVSKHSNEYILHQHEWFLNFDGVHYFNNQYEYQPNHAFLPFFVSIIQFMKATIGSNLTLYLIVGINRIIFSLNAFNIYRIIEAIDRQKDQKIHYYATVIYLYNPSSIFYHVVYSESLYCFVSCSAIKILLQKEKNNEIKSVCLLSLAIGLRSNGIFLSPIIGLQILVAFVFNLTKNLKQSFLTFIKGGVVLLLLILPFLLSLVFNFYNVCLWNEVSGQLCGQSRFVNIYSSVQQKYWNVGFFTYYKLRNILFIIIGSPSILISLYGLISFSHSDFELRKCGLFVSFGILVLVTLLMTNLQSSTRFFSSHPLFYYILAKMSIQFRLIRVWIIFYFLIGMLLFNIGFPWT